MCPTLSVRSKSNTIHCTEAEAARDRSVGVAACDVEEEVSGVGVAGSVAADGGSAGDAASSGFGSSAGAAGVTRGHGWPVAAASSTAFVIKLISRASMPYGSVT